MCPAYVATALAVIYAADTILPPQPGSRHGIRAARWRGCCARAFEVAGANAFPTVALTFRSGVLLLATSDLVFLRARFAAADRLDGELFGAGFDRHRVSLRRERTTIIVD